MEEIKNEIVRSCPLVISDGTKPLRVNFHQYGDCSLEVIVDVKMLPLFSISNIEQVSYIRVLLAVGGAVKNKDGGSK
jgi:hypothetical protein